tara:strand:- start:330 stop:515 length:186 start_codon:yes stop_codon:yes gene_type:complete
MDFWIILITLVLHVSVEWKFLRSCVAEITVPFLAGENSSEKNALDRGDPVFGSVIKKNKKP